MAFAILAIGFFDPALMLPPSLGVCLDGRASSAIMRNQEKRLKGAHRAARRLASSFVFSGFLALSQNERRLTWNEAEDDEYLRRYSREARRRASEVLKTLVGASSGCPISRLAMSYDCQCGAPIDGGADM